MKKFLLFLLICLIIAGGGVGISLGVREYVAHHSDQLVMMTIADTITGLGEREEIAPITKMLNGGSLAFSTRDLSIENAEEEIESLSGKLYFSEDALMLEHLLVEGGAHDLDIDAYFSDDLLYFSENNYLKQAFGSAPADLSDQFQNSVFAYENNTYYSFNQTNSEQIFAMCETISRADEIKKDQQELYEAIYKDVWEILCEHLVFSLNIEDVTHGDETHKRRVLYVTATEDALVEAAKNIYSYFEADERIPAYLEKYSSLLDVMQSDQEDKGTLERYEEDLADIGESMTYYCESIRKEVDEQLTMRLVCPVFSKEMLFMQVTDGDEEIFLLDFGTQGVRKTAKITLGAEDDLIVYEILKNDENEYQSRFGTDMDYFNITVDKQRNTFSASYTCLHDNLEIVCSCDIFWEDQQTHIRLKRCEIYDTEQQGNPTFIGDVSFSLNLIITESDPMPAAPTQYQSIADLTVDRIMAWKDGW